MGYRTARRSSWAPQALHVHVSSFAPSAPNGVLDVTAAVRRKACAPQPGQTCPGEDVARRGASRAATRFSSAAMRAGKSLTVFQIGNWSRSLRMSETDNITGLSLRVDSDLAKIVATMLSVAPGFGFSITYRVTRDGAVMETVVDVPGTAAAPEKDVA